MNTITIILIGLLLIFSHGYMYYLGKITTVKKVLFFIKTFIEQIDPSTDFNEAIEKTFNRTENKH